MNTRRGKQTLTEEQKAKLLKAADEARERVSKRNAISRLAPASWLDADASGWTCMYRSEAGETASLHGNIRSVLNMALRLGATSIALARETT